MQLILNGRPFNTDLTSLLILLEHLSIHPETVVVEINGSLYKHPQFPQVLLSHGDKIEIVHFVGGGS